MLGNSLTFHFSRHSDQIDSRFNPKLSTYFSTKCALGMIFHQNTLPKFVFSDLISLLLNAKLSKSNASICCSS